MQDVKKDERQQRANNVRINALFIIIVIVLGFLCVTFLIYTWEITVNATEKNAGQLAMSAAVFVSICIIAIFITIYAAFIRNKELRKEKRQLLELDEKLKESEMLFRTIFYQAPIGIAIGHDNSYFRSPSENELGINPMFAKITGWPAEKFDLISWEDITHPDDLASDRESFKRFKAGEIKGYDMEKRYIRPDGSEVWVHMTIAPLKINNSQNFDHLCLIEDISKRKEMETALFNSERSKAVLLDNLPGMAYRCAYDREWTMFSVSQGCYDLTGYKAESLINNNEKSFEDLILLKYRDYIWNKWAEVLKTRSKFKEEYEIITATGEVKWVWEQGQGVFDEQGKVLSLEGLIIDITERKKSEMEVIYINNHDFLTGLYNRRYFVETVNRELRVNLEGKRAVMLVYLRNFSLVNATFGYQYGEKLIIESAQNLSSLCTDNFQLFSLSNNRFIFYVRQYNSKDELIGLCKSIIEVMRPLITTHTLLGNIGVVEIDDTDDADADSLLKNASLAAENVNLDQTFGYSFFDSEMEAEILRELEIKNELAKAAEDRDYSSFYLEFQPILNLKTNNIIGYEALARMKSEKLGQISPTEFISIAEKSQLIMPLGKQIIYKACCFLKKLEMEGYRNVRVSFNISAIQLVRDDFIPGLLRIIKEVEIDSSNLTIEITESVFADNYQEINNKLMMIKKHGIQIAIDDYGTGYSSLAREGELNVDYIKIDKHFLDKLLVTRGEEAITADIISLAHKLGFMVIAEGVEYEEQKEYLIQNNCDGMQGFLFSRPISQAAAIELLKEQRK